MNSDYLAVAAEENNVEDLRDLLRYGADINFQDWNKVAQTALHAAAQFSHPEVAKLLLAHPEIDVNLQDKGKHTSFYISCGREDSSVFHLVLKDPELMSIWLINVETPRCGGHLLKASLESFSGQLQANGSWTLKRKGGY